VSLSVYFQREDWGPHFGSLQPTVGTEVAEAVFRKRIRICTGWGLLDSDPVAMELIKQTFYTGADPQFKNAFIPNQVRYRLS
jgi:hypothetical protein